MHTVKETDMLVAKIDLLLVRLNERAHEKEAVSMWDKCFTVSLTKFFSMRKTNALRAKISNFQQTSLESIHKVWERLEDYIQACPHHEMENWLML